MNILYGICGIGNGHLYRQLPLVDHLLSQGHRIMFFSYGSALSELSQRYAHLSHVRVVEVWVPFYAGGATGLDFKATQEINQPSHFHKNLKAYREAEAWLGVPDLVISDYEPTCVQYGYAHACRVVTLDQQSKYLSYPHAPELNGLTPCDEVARLRMFFPVAQRIACSFFQIPPDPHDAPGGHHASVRVIAPILRPRIKAMKNKPCDTHNHHLVYLSAQSGHDQSLGEMLSVLGKSEERFCVFAPASALNAWQRSKSDASTPQSIPANVEIFAHGHARFEQELEDCASIIATAGHNLLSEAMHLGIPVYAMALPVYEQQLNAHVIGQHGFGVAHPRLEIVALKGFIANLGTYRHQIASDTTVLLKQEPKDALTTLLECLNIGD